MATVKSYTKTVFVGAISEEVARKASEEGWFSTLEKARDVASGYRTKYKFFQLTVRMTVTGIRPVVRRARKVTP